MHTTATGTAGAAGSAARRLPAPPVGDCERCAGLCCVALPFSAGSEFGYGKKGGEPCKNLAPGYMCTIHRHLLAEGFPGCVNFDCHGAGQHVTQVTFGGGDWQRNPSVAEDMFAAFRVVWPLFELRSLLDEAVFRAEGLGPGRAVGAAVASLGRLRSELDHDVALPPGPVAAVNVRRWRERVMPPVELISRTVRAANGGVGADRRGADLAGARLEGADLARATLTGTVLARANLRRADLRGADVTGADFRAADVRGADLRGVLFLRKNQLHSARGDKHTRIDKPHRRPPHWS